MAGGTNKKKLFQVAKELNLGKETIKEFLEKKGIEVTGLNMRLEEDVYELVLSRFSREKKEADKIHRRREERHRDDQSDSIDTKLEEDETISQTESAKTEESELEQETAVSDDVADVVETDDVVDEQSTISDEYESSEPVETRDEEDESVDQDDDFEDDDVDLETVADEAELEEDSEDFEEEFDEDVDEEEFEDDEDLEDDEEPEEEVEDEKPQVGDIIDHPMAKIYMERQRKLEDEKRQRQINALLRIKTAPEKEEKPRKKQRSEDGVSEKEAALDKDGNVIPVEEIDEATGKPKKKKEKKKDRDTVEEKEARRKKAFEMLRKERKTLRTEIPSTEEEVEEPLKEGRRKRRKKKKAEVNQQEVDSTLRKTLAEMRDSGTGRKKRKKVRAELDEEGIDIPKIKVSEFITTQDLANLLDTPVADVIRKCLEIGLVVTINQRLDMDTIRLLAEEFGYDIEEEEEFGSDFIEDESDEEDQPEDHEPRAPVVTIMGHVDHGKTSLLDYVRKTNVVGGESGGITQHIGAYEVKLDDGRKVTFLDTPGHEAFTAMRARGAQVTDIVVLVIASDDRVMPQTEEALDHAKAAGVAIVIALNKVDKPNANPEAIRKQLADRNVLVEDWGGQYGCVEVSAKSGKGVPELLDRILLEAELLDLKANPKKRAKGVVLEAQLDRGKGPVATVMVEEGTLQVGQTFIIGQHWGRVRAMINEWGKRTPEAGPSTPVQILGIDGMPEAGDRFVVLDEERQAREISNRRQQLKREQDFRQVKLLTLDELSKQIKTGDVKELKLLVKADVDGSTQALTDSLQKLSTKDVEVHVIRRAVGPITESDVILAAASQAIIIGFHVRPTVSAKDLADREKVDIRQYKVIYDAIEDVEKALEGLLEPVEREVVQGQAEVREIFKISRIGTIGGCYVLSGKITRNSRVRVVRNDVELYDGKLESLKRFKDDVREVLTGYECGMSIVGFNDIKPGDIIEAYEIVMEAQTLR